MIRSFFVPFRFQLLFSFASHLNCKVSSFKFLFGQFAICLDSISFNSVNWLFPAAACKARPQPRRAGGLRGNSFRYGRQNLASHPSSDKKPCSAGVGGGISQTSSKLF